MQLSVTAATVAANAVTSLLNNGYVQVYTAPRPASTEVGVTTQVLLAQPRFGAIAFASATAQSVAGQLVVVASANAIADDASTPHAGEAFWFRLVKADGTTVIADGSCGVGDLDISTDDGFDMELATTTIEDGRRFGVMSMRYTHPRS